MCQWFRLHSSGTSNRWFMEVARGSEPINCDCRAAGLCEIRYAAATCGRHMGTATGNQFELLNCRERQLNSARNALCVLTTFNSPRPKASCPAACFGNPAEARVMCYLSGMSGSGAENGLVSDYLSTIDKAATELPATWAQRDSPTFQDTRLCAGNGNLAPIPEEHPGGDSQHVLRVAGTVHAAREAGICLKTETTLAEAGHAHTKARAKLDIALLPSTCRCPS